MEVKVLDSYEDLSKKSAVFVARHLIKNPDLTLGLPTGDTPKGLYRELIDLYDGGVIDFSDVITFNLDEYYPVSRDDQISFTRYMYDRFFDDVNVPQNRIYIPDGSTEDIEHECCNYEISIAEAGGIDLQVLGIGRNGHIGYNEPGSAWDSETRLVDLEEENSVSQVSERSEQRIDQAITMGIKTIMNAREILLLASGKEKAPIIDKTLNGSVTRDVPSSILQLHPRVTVYVDGEAAEEC